MGRISPVSAPPAKPLMVFDGGCHFCSLWIRRWQQLTGSAVDYLPSSDPRVALQFPEIPQAQYDTAVQLIATNGSVYSGAEAVFRALAENPRWRWVLHAYEKYPVFANPAERLYHFIASHRPLFSKVTRLCWGLHVETSPDLLVRWLFLRGLAAIYLFAFLSLWTQIAGLAGHDGILPVDQFMSAVTRQCDARGIGLERFYLLPTLCWLNSSDNFLNFQCLVGVVLSVLLFLGVASVPCMSLLWLFYLSLATVTGDFLSFQWDGLLLETGFLAIFFAPWQLLPRPSGEAPPSRLMVWLLRLLLFKLMFSSGCVKILSGDPNWRNLTALTYHYQTQPLPSWISWYANQLPLWFQTISCGTVLAIEIAAPFLVFMPRRLRFGAAALFAWLLFLVILTGNYTFFNWLTLVLCLLLLDDFCFENLVPKKVHACFKNSAADFTGFRWPRTLLVAMAVVVFSASTFMLAVTLGIRSPLLAPLGWMARQIKPFRTVNNYGLFAVMTTRRNEIIIEGSNDGVNWLAYEFKYKPGDVNRRPQFVAPFQPRLDWQMWFAALGRYEQNPWFPNFCERLLQGSPAVLALLENNPFPGRPPCFIRAQLYNYRFTSFDERHATGAWWHRELIGPYMPPVSLRQ
jgi:lipase maturation factor 1